MLFLFSLCAPLLGTFLPSTIALIIVGIALILKHGASVYAITFGIPTLIATLGWLVEQRTGKSTYLLKIGLNIILPLCCIVAFVIHPVGNQAFAYALYWLIPPLLMLWHGNLFNTALRITFVTHAIGSILWLYALPTTPAFWLALIPFVALERLCFATISTIMIQSIKTIARRYQTLQSSQYYAYDINNARSREH